MMMRASTRTILTTRLLLLLLVASSCFQTPPTTHAYSWFVPSTRTTRRNARPVSQQPPQQHEPPPPQHNPRQPHAPRMTSRSGSTTKQNKGVILERRNFWQTVTRSTLATATWAVVLPSSNRAQAAVMQNIPDNVFQVGKDLSRTEAQQRFQQGQTSLTNLLEQYEMICDQGGGDNIRRYLGTVGMTSGLYGITKVLKVLQETATDIVDYTETMEAFNAALTGADGSAYMAIFAGSSTSTVPATQYYQDAKRDIQRAHQLMQELAKQLELNEASK